MTVGAKHQHHVQQLMQPTSQMGFSSSFQFPGSSSNQANLMAQSVAVAGGNQNNGRMGMYMSTHQNFNQHDNMAEEGYEDQATENANRVVGSEGNESYDEQKLIPEKIIQDDQFEYGQENEEIEVEIADGEDDNPAHAEADYTSDQGDFNYLQSQMLDQYFHNVASYDH